MASSVEFVENEFPCRDMFSESEELLVNEEDANSDQEDIVSEVCESKADDYEKSQKAAEDENVDDEEDKEDEDYCKIDKSESNHQGEMIHGEGDEEDNQFKTGDDASQTTELTDSTIYMSIPEWFQSLHPEIDNQSCGFLWYNAINGLM